MEITQAEFATYRPSTDIPNPERRVRILSCVHNQPPIRSFTLYEGTVEANINNPAPLLNQIILYQGATQFVVVNQINTANGPAPLTNGRIQFPFDGWDFNIYYWKYIDVPERSTISVEKYKPMDSSMTLKRKRPLEIDRQVSRRLIFAGKSKRKTKRHIKRKVIT